MLSENQVIARPRSLTQAAKVCFEAVALDSPAVAASFLDVHTQIGHDCAHIGFAR